MTKRKTETEIETIEQQDGIQRTQFLINNLIGQRDSALNENAHLKVEIDMLNRKIKSMEN